MYRNIPSMIRAEYGEPMSEVIKGYALMGYSKLAIASALEIGTQAMRAWVRRLGLEGCFCRMNYNESCRPVGRGWPKGKPRKKVN